MANKPLFEGLIFDTDDNPVEVRYVGLEPCYVVDDNGFLRHIPSENVDQQVLDVIRKQIEGNESVISEQAAKMLGQDDLFTHAIIKNQLENIEEQFKELFRSGIPEDGRAYMGMMGFKIIVNIHGEVVDVEQPSSGIEGDE